MYHIGPQGVLINSELTLEASRITQNTRFNVDETNAVSNSDSKSVGDDFRDAPSSPTRSPDTQYESLEQKCERIRDNLLQENTVLVRRESLKEDVLDAYRANKGLEHHNVHMKIKGEPALDVSRVKREVYSMFFMQVFLQCFVGNLEVMPEMNPEFICSDLFVLIGRIMAHAFVLVGYFPIRLCKAAMITMITGSCSAEVVMSSFLSYVFASQRAVIQKTTQNDPSHVRKNLFYSAYSMTAA
ncbi:hypothetical protein DPMN_100699 [Dreissena polymorpha]|uniref:Uncharacterized protein n=1 Tax=Dreissena polymorpha TaxID=45954 RepID=A0A9D4LGD5_DREPO|nr:hypothetical protein DPMN_100699 [Dreissena polymorpha]